jgi:hypothetical protein
MHCPCHGECLSLCVLGQVAHSQTHVLLGQHKVLLAWSQRCVVVAFGGFWTLAFAIPFHYISSLVPWTLSDTQPLMLASLAVAVGVSMQSFGENTLRISPQWLDQFDLYIAVGIEVLSTFFAQQLDPLCRPLFNRATPDRSTVSMCHFGFSAIAVNWSIDWFDRSLIRPSVNSMVSGALSSANQSSCRWLDVLFQCTL